MSLSIKGILLGLLSMAALAGCGTKPSRNMKDLPNSKLLSFAGIDDYQIGPTWGKKAVTQATLEKYTPEVQRAIKATAYISLGMGGATGFILGEKDGDLVMATNNHVISSNAACQRARIKFSMLGISGLRCAELYGTWTDVDFTLFKLTGYNSLQKTQILSVARAINFEMPITKGQKLATIGFGVAGNPQQQNIMATTDEDCKVYSPDGETRFMSDPDELNPGPHKVWGFAVGCDVSHGDSGSAMIDEVSGDVVGILFTGKIPKNPVVRQRDWLDDIYARGDEAVWKELTFAVPAAKIQEVTGFEL